MVSAHLEVLRDKHWEYVAKLHHWSTKSPQVLWHSYGEFQIPFRGLPQDISDMTDTCVLTDAENQEFMNPTWITLEELRKRLSQLPYDKDFENWVICCEGFEAHQLETRIVFWMQAYT